MATLLEEVRNKGIVILGGAVLGAVTTWVVGRRKRMRERRSILEGDARDTVLIAQHIVESVETPSKDGRPVRRPSALHIRSLGQAELPNVVPNGHLAAVLLKRAFEVTSSHTLISMTGAEGSYLLETLTNFVCDRVANAPFEHDLYVMAPCCEPAGLAVYQPITILLISVADLALFAEWPMCRDIHVEHGADGMRVLTLMELARRFQEEQAELVRLKQAGQRTRYVETMYTLDLALDRRAAAIPLKPVPWGRFEQQLNEMNLE